jgi:hypothetical protein
MPWTQSQQIAVESTAAGFASEYATAVNTWTNAIQAGGGAAVAEARVQDVIQRWEGFVQNLQNSSDIVTSNESAMDKQIADLRITSKITLEEAMRAKMKSQGLAKLVAKAELVEQQKRDKAEENQFEDILAARTRIHSGTKDA